jgi:hypothetical protein
MNVDAREVEQKILEIYPDLKANGIDVQVDFEKESDAWLVRFRKPGHEEYTSHIDQDDAGACMEGRQCVNLAHKVGTYVNRTCGGTQSCTVEQHPR